MTSLPPPSPDAVPNQPLPPPTVPVAPTQQYPTVAAPPPDTPGGGTTPPPARRSVPIWAVVLGLLAVVGLGVGGVLLVTGGDDDGASDTTATAVDTTVTPDTAAPATAPPVTLPGTTAAPDTSTPDTAPPDTSAPDTVPPGPTEGEIAGAPAGLTGDRANPVPAGEIADIGGGWRLQVLEVVPDATSLILEANEFNEPPAEGTVFTLVRVALGYFGVEDPKTAFEPTISAVGADDVELDSYCGFLPNSFNYFGYVFAGGVVTGDLCFVTSAADPGALDLYATGSFFTGETVFLDVAPASVTPMVGLVGPQPGARATGPRTAPQPLGTTAEVGDGWTVTVLAPARDITDTVMAEDFNQPPPDGHRFIGVDITYAYAGVETSGAYAVTARAVSNSNVEHLGPCGYFEGEIDFFADVFTDGTVTGTICFVVPEAEVPNLAVAFEAGFEPKPAFMAVR